MEKPSLLTDETDRIRSGAILTASRRDTARDIGLNASQVFPPTTPISVNSFRSTSDRARPLSRIAGSTVLDLRSTRPIPQESINNFDVEKGLANEGISTKDGESYKSESKSSGDNALAGDDTASREKKEKQKLPFKHRIKRGTFRFWLHTKNAITHSWLNLLLVFVPIGLASEFAHLSPSIIFAMNSVAIIPLAGLLTMATESVAGRLGDTWGALLNVSFGNAVELIIFIIALVKNEIRIVQAALLGSILANMLLILGMAFLLGGLRYREQIYNSTITQLSSCLLSLSVMSLLLPTAFHASFEDNRVADRATLKISRGTSVILLFVYFLYLLFQLNSHSYLYESMPQEQIDEETEPAFLHQMFESNSSFSSSHDTSSSDGESRSAKNKHGNRIKRAFTHKKSLKSSGKSQGKQGNKKPHLVDAEASALISIKIDEPVLVAEAGEITQSTNRLATMDTVVRGDKIGVKGAAAPLTSSSPRVRDLDRSADTASIVDLEDTDTADARLQDFKSPSRRSRKSRKEESRKRKKRERRTPRDEEVAMAHQVGFINVGREQPQISNRPPPRTRGSLLRPNLPKLFSENIFVKPVRPSELQRYPSRLQRYPSNIPTTPLQRGKSMIHRAPSQRSQYLSLMARRTNSSPKLTAGNSKQEPLPTPTVPGRSMQPSVEPPPFKEPHDENKDSDEDDAEEIDDLHNPDMSHFAAVVLLLASTGLVALCAEFLVGAITEMTKNSAVSQAFIGLIILPIVGNAAEHVTAVVVASKNKMDLAIGVALGSSIQIALFVTPLVVIVGWAMGRTMTLYFTFFETISLFVTIFVVNFLVIDGKSNYLEGVLLMAAYIIIAIAAFFYPDTASASELGGTPRNSTISPKDNSTAIHMIRFMFQ